MYSLGMLFKLALTFISESGELLRFCMLTFILFSFKIKAIHWSKMTHSSGNHSKWLPTSTPIYLSNSFPRDK